MLSGTSVRCTALVYSRLHLPALAVLYPCSNSEKISKEITPTTRFQTPCTALLIICFTCIGLWDMMKV
jgi:hypothetical protein